MISICAWRFNHTSTDLGKLCLSPLLVMLPELPMNSILKRSERQSFRLYGTLFQAEFCLISDNF